MDKEFVTYEVALALKELGFKDYYCFGEWQNLKIGKNLSIYQEDNHIYDVPVLAAEIRAPLKQQIFRWFREKYGWYANLSSWIHEEEIGIYHEYEIYGNPNGVYGDGKYDTYEEAENACIDKLIEIAKQQN